MSTTYINRWAKYYLLILYLCSLIGYCHFIKGCGNDSERENDPERLVFYEHLQNAVDDKNIQATTKSFDLLKHWTEYKKEFFREEKAITFLLKGLDSSQANIRLSTVKIVYCSQDQRIFNALKEHLKNDAEIDVRAAAALSIGIMGLEGAFPVLKDTVLDKTEDSNVRQKAVLGIGALNSKSGDDFLRAHFNNEENERVRGTIITGLFAAFTSHNSTARKNPSDKMMFLFLINALCDKSLNVKESAYGYLPFLFHGDEIFNPDLLKIWGETNETWERIYNGMMYWWKTNNDYLYWYREGYCFLIDEEAKRAGIPTEEYRKNHPWPKEENKDK